MLRTSVTLTVLAIATMVAAAPVSGGQRAPVKPKKGAKLTDRFARGSIELRVSSNGRRISQIRVRMRVADAEVPGQDCGEFAETLPGTPIRRSGRFRSSGQRFVVAGRFTRPARVRGQVSADFVEQTFDGREFHCKESAAFVATG